MCGEALPPASQLRQPTGAPARSDAKLAQDTEANRPVAAKPDPAAAPGRAGSAGAADRSRLSSAQLDQLASAARAASVRTPPATPPLVDAAPPKPNSTPPAAQLQSPSRPVAKPRTQPSAALNPPASPAARASASDSGASTKTTRVWLKQAMDSTPPVAAATSKPAAKPASTPAAPRPASDAPASRLPSVRVIVTALIAVCGLVLGGLLVRAGWLNGQKPLAAAPAPSPAATVKIAIVFAGATAPPTPSETPMLEPTATSLDGVAVLPPQIEPTATLTVSEALSAASVITPEASISSSATPEPTLAPTETLAPTPTQTPADTATARPTATATPAATATSAATETATASPSPSPTATTRPSATPQPSSTATRAPTATPRPTETPAPTSTKVPVPTATLVPTSKPSDPDEPIAYLVQDGDSCLAIARRFGITVARLVAYNGLDPDTCFLRTGKPVLIPPGEARPTATPAPTNTPAPTATPVTGAPYEVQPGDTCLDIAQRYKISVAELASANQLDRRTCFINAGRTLIIPSAVTPTTQPTGQPTGQPTSTIIDIVPAPVLAAPANGTALPANQAEVQLSWRFEGTLAYDEYFVVKVQPSGASQAQIFQTKSKSIGVPRDALPAASQTVSWQVQVRRVVANESGSSALKFEDSGPPSAVWSFRWP